MSPENIRVHAKEVASTSEVFKTSRDVTFDACFVISHACTDPPGVAMG